jgi:hypothetical protein
VFFRVFFVPLKQFLQFLDLFLALKINSKKNKTILPDWAESAARPNPLRPARARAGSPARPAKAHRPRQAMAVATASPRPGRARQVLEPRVPIKGGGRAPRAACPSSPARRHCPHR